MTGPKTNERPGTRAVARHVRMSAYKARVVLDLIRGKDVTEAEQILRFTERDAARVIRKVLASAVANAEHNDSLPADELYVAACFADEGRTLRRFRPRARGRATRIRKRMCHITIIVDRLPADELERRRQREAARPGSRAARRAAQEAAEQRRRRRRRGGAGDAEAPEAEEPTTTAEEAGIADPQDAALEALEAAEATGTDAGAGVEAPETVAEEAGIADQQDAAVVAAQETEEPGGEEPVAEITEAAEDEGERKDEQ